MKTQARHWFTVTTAVVATIGASLAMAFGPTPTHDAGLEAGYGVHSGLAAVTFVAR
jgi:hypothetical protein